VNRSVYDHFWVRAAQDAGAELIDGRKAVSVDVIRRTVALEGGMRIRANVIIGADGVWSKIRKALFPQELFKQRWQANLATTIEASRPLVAGASGKGIASLHFGYAPWGYAWCFPNPGRQIVGIGALCGKRGTSLAKAFQEFIAATASSQEELDTWKGHALPFGNYLDPPGIGQILLVGDACGLADPLLGEGIFYAHRSGELAAQAILTAIPDGNDPASHYRQSLNKHVLRELRWIKFYRNLLFYGGFRRRYRGLKLFFRLMPDRLEAAVQGKISFSRLVLPWD
jgi:flavin-dependent dehydrogenase